MSDPARKVWICVSSGPPVEGETVRRFVRRQRRILELARGWLELPQVVAVTPALGVARSLLEASEENLGRLAQGLDGRTL